MILIPEQISDLRKQREKLLEKIETYKEYLKSKEKMDSDRNANTIVGDSFIDGHYHRDKDNLSEINHILETSDYLKERPLDTIGIGTKFVVSFDTLKDTKTVILTECIYGLGVDKNFISLESLLGQNVIGKKEGDEFSYIVVTGQSPKDKRKISGKVVEIKKDNSDYTTFIREVPKSKRMTDSKREQLNELKESDSEEAKKELSTYDIITPSQKYLLEIEKDRLIKRKDKKSRNRVEKINQILTQPVATEIPEDIIEVGTKFEIAIAPQGEEPEIKNYEMINIAVSDELCDDYIERISPLGNKVYGLHAGDTFKLKKENKIYTGVVTHIGYKQTNEKNKQFIKK